LKKLLHHEACGDQQWMMDHPLNRAFVEKLRERGLRLEPWLGPTERHYLVRGERWTVRVETNPLKVLWMGRLFGTCLSPGDVNAFATVANAVEINKRVLYMTDSKDRIIGRKLLALSREGVMFGFRSYGSCEPSASRGGSPWVKILFDVFCLRMVLRMGARLPTREEEQAESERSEEKFRLFANWYFDGYEPFDGWVKDLAVRADSFRGFMRQALLDDLTRSLVENGKGFAQDDGATIRALLWLGPDAATLVQEASDRGALTNDQRDFLTAHGQNGPGRVLALIN
jgi:hypothetical protein